eukprot:438812-Pyramimonas_sp.AAC.2
MVELSRVHHGLLSLEDNAVVESYGCKHNVCSNERVLKMVSNMAPCRDEEEHCVRAGLGEFSSDEDL